jgi:hypothetical protein
MADHSVRDRRGGCLDVLEPTCHSDLSITHNVRVMDCR